MGNYSPVYLGNFASSHKISGYPSVFVAYRCQELNMLTTDIFTIPGQFCILTQNFWLSITFCGKQPRGVHTSN